MKRLITHLITALSILAGCIIAARPAHADSQTTVRLTKYHIKTPYQEKFREALSQYVLSSLQAAGNIMAEAYYEEQDPSILWIIERWSERELLDKNDHSGAAKEIIALAKDGLASPAEIIFAEDLEPLPKAAYQRSPKASDQPLTIMLFVDAKAGTEDNFKTIYHAAMPAFRDEPGVVTYQLCQLPADRTKFITYEKFRSQAAFQDHLKLAAVEPVIQYLRTSIKEQPFEKGLHRLIEMAPLHRE